MWQTRKKESIFKLKDKITHLSHVIYQGKRTCGQTYIGETARNLNKMLMNIQMLISSRSQPSTSVNTLTTSSRGKF